LSKIRQQVLVDSVVAKRPVIDTAEKNYLALLNTNSYQKGGYVLYMLHRRIGDSAFFGGLHAYYARYRDGNATSDDLRRELERTSKQDLNTFFDQWLRRPGYATPAIGWAYDAGARTISVVVLQDSSSGSYELPLTVAVRDAAGTERRVEVRVPAQPRAEVILPGRYDRPVSIVFDPDAFLLARIRLL
jgi:aminopeptidase N